MPACTVRPAEAGDLRSIAEIQCASFKSAYAGVLPKPFLDNLTVHERYRSWVAGFERHPENIMVATASDHCVAAYTCAGPVRDKNEETRFPFEVYGLHVHPDHRRRGYGKALLRAAFERARQALGLNAAIIWTLWQTPLSRRFYVREGGTLLKLGLWPIAGQHIVDAAYVWPDLDQTLKVSD